MHTPKYLLEHLTAIELAEWEAYDSIDPIGSTRSDIHFAAFSSMITNLFIAAYGKQGSTMTEPKDFLINWDGSKKESTKQEQSVDQIKDFLSALQKQQERESERKMARGEINKRKKI